MFTGSYVALVTPFKEGAVDWSALNKLVAWHLQEGTHGLVPVGTTGESPTLTPEEHKEVVASVVKQVAGQIPVIAGTGSNNPQEAIELTLHAQSVKADGVLSVAGYYNRPNQEGLYRHFEAIHEATDIPIVIYNIPPRTIVDIQVDTMTRLAKLPRVVGVKDATLDLGRISQERHSIGEDFSYFSGEDITTLAYRSMGGMGGISVTANIVPKLLSQMHVYCDQGDFGEALAIHEQLVPLHNALFSEPSPAGVKFAASLLGLCEEECRLPIVPLSNESKQNIEQVLKMYY